MTTVLPQQNSITPSTVFQIIRNINDPEHPKTLEQLDVVQESLIICNDNYITLTFTPTIPHCSMATLIGLCIRVKLERELPRNIKFDVSITPGSHSQEVQVTKQLRDKERVHAALENPSLMSLVEKCIEINELNNPVFFNPNASCGNTTGQTRDEQEQHPHQHNDNNGECCGGHGNNNNNNNDNQSNECCGGNNKNNDNKQQDECCGGGSSKHDIKSTETQETNNDECCGGNGNNDGCCQSK